MKFITSFKGPSWKAISISLVSVVIIIIGFTFYLVQAIEESGGKLNYNELITRIGKGLREYQQIPQLECPDELKNQPIFLPYQI